ncbi:MAG: hypothetical protein ACFB13_05000 [Kiloniellaceae bacterium]
MSRRNEQPDEKRAAGPTTLYFRVIGDAQAAGLPHQVDWAVGELASRLDSLAVALRPAGQPSGDGEASIVVALGAGEEIGHAARAADVALPDAPESFAIFAGSGAASEGLYVYGADLRGLIYAILELADRAECTGSLPDAAAFAVPLVERPAAAVRSISRCFQSDVEDRAWFHDRDGWRAYLTLLATHRINRISLTLGMQYNYPYGNEFLSDVYFYFAYPFLVCVPGYDVAASNLPATERRRNLDTLKFIGQEAARRGLEFQLGLWTQNYDFDDCPKANHQITGVTDDNLAGYCRDALATILAEVPEISGLTLRVHVECGIPEGRYDFWRTYFTAVRQAGRPIRLDLHAKGIDGELIETALATGMPVSVSPKYTSEHLGLPYHQTSIRQLEQPAPEQPAEQTAGRDLTTLYSGRDAEKHAAKWKFSEGSRKFMRYSYGDLLREDRPYDIVYRIWPGTLRVLLWGDPALAGGYGRSSTFCGAKGVELCEPLSFKGRMGTGAPGRRSGYKADDPDSPADWQKFAYTYRVWGRSLYDPEADPQAFHRDLTKRFGPAAAPCGRALASASRILPLITLAHTPTASNNSYWPEMYQNMSLVHEAPYLPYGYELFKPARFGTVGSCDPQLFMSPAAFAQCVYRGDSIRRIAPLTWANWLDDLATTAQVDIARATTLADAGTGEFERFRVDVTILAAIGKFFAEKVRAAVFWEYYLLSGEARAAQDALERYHRARDAWQEAARACRDVYVEDITYGPHAWLRGRWDDRLPAIERDIEDMAACAAEDRLAGTSESALGLAHLAHFHSWSTAQRHPCRHTPPDGFTRGGDLALSCKPLGASRHDVFLHYRHVNQSEPWQCVAMDWSNEAYQARIAGDYTRSSFPLQYYFEIQEEACAKFYPGLVDTLSNQPYFVLHGS